LSTFKKLLLLVVILGFIGGLIWLSPISGMTVVTAQDGPDYYFPIFQNSRQPLASTSYYMITMEPSFLYDLGCQLGTRDAIEPEAQDSVAVLDFSYPVCNAGGTFGAELFGFGPVPLTDIATATQYFMQGYYECSAADTESNLVVGIGTNNKPTSCDTSEKIKDHGTAWAEMVNGVNQWAIDNNYIHQVQAYGASDIELGWNTPSMSKAWLAGYDMVNEYPLLHFGDAAGCPYEDNPLWDCGTFSFPEWTSEDVWFVSWGSPPALPLPLIYLTNGIHAKQWAYLSQYGVSQYGARMDFTGVFTQSQACEQWGCNGTDNTPYEAYWQLYDELNKYPTTAQELLWKTDIRWILREEAYPSIYSATRSPLTQVEHPIQSKIEFLQTEIQNPELRAEVQESLAEKINLFENLALKINTSRLNPAPKSYRTATEVSQLSDPVFRTGILTDGDIAGLPYGVIIVNVWQRQTNDGYLQIAAGTSPENPSQGALYILLTSLDKSASNAQMLLIHEGSGALQIVAEHDNGLSLQSLDGTKFFFDLNTFSLSELPH
jgi:hypothetical protein